MKPEPPDLAGYRPTKWWHEHPASEGQLQMLRRLGLDDTLELSKGEASFLIDRALSRVPDTRRQRYSLCKAGHWREGMSKREAQETIRRLKGTATGHDQVR
jgi:hypothetical protein